MTIYRKRSQPISIEAMAEVWLSTAEAARYLKMTPRALLLGVRKGAIPAYRLSGTKRHVYRFLDRDLDAALLSRPVAVGIPSPVKGVQ